MTLLVYRPSRPLDNLRKWRADDTRRISAASPWSHSIRPVCKDMVFWFINRGVRGIQQTLDSWFLLSEPVNFSLCLLRRVTSFACGRWTDQDSPLMTSGGIDRSHWVMLCVGLVLVEWTVCGWMFGVQGLDCMGADGKIWLDCVCCAVAVWCNANDHVECKECNWVEWDQKFGQQESIDLWWKSIKVVHNKSLERLTIWWVDRFVKIPIVSSELGAQT